MTAPEPCLCGDPACGICTPRGAPDDRAPPEVHLVTAEVALAWNEDVAWWIVAAYSARMDADLHRDRARRAQAAADPADKAWTNPEDPHFQARCWKAHGARATYRVVTCPLDPPDPA